MNKYCVLTNDLQRELIDKNAQRKANVMRMTPFLVEFLAGARELDVPVIHLQLIYEETETKVELHDGQIPVLRGTPGAEMVSDFLGPGDIIVEKSKDSGFFKTRLEGVLHDLGVDTVILTGMQAQICIQTTAADAHFRGYNVIVPSDGIVSTRDEDRLRAIEWLASYCAVVRPMNDVLESIRSKVSYDFTLPSLP